MNLKGQLTLELRDQFGFLKSITVVNTVTTDGKQGAADQLLATPTLGKPTYMAIGTGIPTATALGAEVSRVAFQSKTRAGAVVTMIGFYDMGVGTGSLTEAGTFDASSSGKEWMYASFTAIPKGVADTLTVTWTLTYS